MKRLKVMNRMVKAAHICEQQTPWGCPTSLFFYRVEAGLVSAGVKVGDKPPPYAVLESKHNDYGEDHASKTELWAADALVCPGKYL